MAWFSYELGCVRVNRIANHLAMEHGARSAGDALTGSVDRATLPIFLALAITHFGLPTVFMLLSMHERRHLILDEFELVHHGLRECTMTVTMVTARPTSVLISLANALHTRAAICNSIQALAGLDHGLEVMMMAPMALCHRKEACEGQQTRGNHLILCEVRGASLESAKTL